MRLPHSSIVDCSIVQLQHSPNYKANTGAYTLKHNTLTRADIKMASYAQTQTHGILERGFAFLADVFHNAAAYQARRTVYRTTLAELRALSDRELADLGMNRAMLSSIAWQSALEHEAR